ncbi:hypothetical protein quinque_012281 [Culex quinquefasciatus]
MARAGAGSREFDLRPARPVTDLDAAEFQQKSSEGTTSGGINCGEACNKNQLPKNRCLFIEEERERDANQKLMPDFANQHMSLRPTKPSTTRFSNGSANLGANCR